MPITDPDRPQLPFEGGLPEITVPKGGRRRSRKQAAPGVQSSVSDPPSRSSWTAVKRAVVAYIARLLHDVFVQVAVALVLAMLGVAHFGFNAFDLKSRDAVPDPDPWTTEIVPAPTNR